MDFYEVLNRVLEILQQHKRVTYRALQRQFDLDEAYLEDLQAEIIEARQLAVDEGEHGVSQLFQGEVQHQRHSQCE